MFFPWALYSSHCFTDVGIWVKLLCGILMGDGYETPFSHFVCLPCWFLICIIHLRLLFGVVPINKYTSLLLITSCICFLIILKHYSFDLYFCLDNTMMAIPYFLCGYYWGKRQSTGYNNTFLLVMGIVSAIAIWIILNINGPAQMIGPSYGENIFVNYMAGAFGTLGIWASSNMMAARFNEKKFIRIISRNTLFIIFFHWVLLAPIGIIVNKILGGFCNNKVSIVFVSLLLSFAVLFVSKITIEFGVYRYPVLFGKMKK